MTPRAATTTAARARPPAATRRRREGRRGSRSRQEEEGAGGGVRGRRFVVQRPRGGGDDDARQRRSRSRACRRRPPPRSRAPGSTLSALEFGVGAKAMFRQLAWTSDARAAGLGPYTLTPGPETGAWLEFYPAAFGSQGFAANIGLFGRFDYGFGVATTLANHTDAATSFRDYLGGIEVRIPTGTFIPNAVRRLRSAGVRESRSSRTPPTCRSSPTSSSGPRWARASCCPPRSRWTLRAGLLMVLDTGSGADQLKSSRFFPEGDVIRHRRVGVRRRQGDRVDRRAWRRRLSTIRHRPSSRLDDARGGGRRRIATSSRGPAWRSCWTGRAAPRAETTSRPSPPSGVAATPRPRKRPNSPPTPPTMRRRPLQASSKSSEDE